MKQTACWLNTILTVDNKRKVLAWEDSVHDGSEVLKFIGSKPSVER